MSENRKVLFLYSGGVDSLAMLLLELRNPTSTGNIDLLYLNFNQASNKVTMELRAIVSQLKHLENDNLLK